MTDSIGLSIIMPVYQNEGIESNIRDIYEKVAVPFQERGYGTTEIIIAEDGSKDRTREILCSIQKKYNLTLNLAVSKRGYVNAVKELYMQAQGEAVFFTDSDGEHDPADFWILWQAFTKSDMDIVVGYKINRKPFYRVALSRVNNTLLGLLFGVWLRDANCGFRVLKAAVAHRIIPLTGTLVASYNAETIVYAKQLGYSYAEVPVRHFPQPSSVFPFRKMPASIVSALKQLYQLKRKLSQVSSGQAKQTH